jgi:hypothetical protein
MSRENVVIVRQRRQLGELRDFLISHGSVPSRSFVHLQAPSHERAQGLLALAD